MNTLPYQTKSDITEKIKLARDTTQADFLESLNQHRSANVRVEVSKNRSTPQHVLERLVFDHDQSVSQEAKANSNTSKLIEQLNFLESQNVLLSPDKIQEIHLNYDFPHINKLVIAHPNCPIHLLEKFAHHLYLTPYIIENPSTSIKILKDIAIRNLHGTSSLTIESRVALDRRINKHEKIEKEKLKRKVQIQKRKDKIEYDFISKIALDPSISIEKINELSPDHYISFCTNNDIFDLLLVENINFLDLYLHKKLLVAHKKAPFFVLNYFARNGSYELKKEIANRSYLNTEVIHTLLDHSPWDIRRIVAKRQNLSHQIYLKLLQDPDEDVRTELITKKNLPRKILEELRKDPSNSISEAAERMTLLFEILSHLTNHD